MENPVYSHWQVPFIDIENYELDKTMVGLIPEDMAREHSILVLDKIKGNNSDILTVATSKPRNQEILEALEKHSGCSIREFKANEDVIKEILDAIYRG